MKLMLLSQACYKMPHTFDASVRLIFYDSYLCSLARYCWSEQVHMQLARMAANLLYATGPVTPSDDALHDDPLAGKAVSHTSDIIEKTLQQSKGLLYVAQQVCSVQVRK